MTRNVVTVHRDQPFKDLVQLMHDHGVSGVPVVDDDGRLVGIVSEADLLLSEVKDREPRPRSLFLEWLLHPKRLQETEERAQDVRARDVMVKDVISVRPETSVQEAIRTLLRHEVKRLPVVDPENRVVGIASRRDLLSPFLREDDEILREVREDIIARTMWIDPATIDVEVRQGVVRLSGQMDRRGAKEILVDLVHRVDGVVGVEDELTYQADDRGARPPPFVSPDDGGSPEHPDSDSRG
ncbi:MAG: CBS domain-containing protein [Actinomycetota bacterium]